MPLSEGDSSYIKFSHLKLLSCDYNMHVEGVLPVNLCLLTVIMQFERFRLQHVKMVNRTPSFRTKLIGNNAEASRVSPLMFNFPTL